MKNFIIPFADFFLPRICPSCRKKLSPSERIICSMCNSKILRPSDLKIKFEYGRKFSSNNFIKSFNSLYIFETDKPVQFLIHELKYGKKFQIGEFLGIKISEYLKYIITGWGVELLIPIPLHPLKRAKRGFNQSYFIAKGISQKLKIPIGNRIVRRAKSTETQTGLSLYKRKENMRGAFKIKNGRQINSLKILLVDDVITTGATLNECAKVLLRQGAKEIYAVSAAISD